jgi:hypothetical protein
VPERSNAESVTPTCAEHRHPLGRRGVRRLQWPAVERGRVDAEQHQTVAPCPTAAAVTAVNAGP